MISLKCYWCGGETNVIRQGYGVCQKCHEKNLQLGGIMLIVFGCILVVILGLGFLKVI
jgi:hypothetical protein